MSHPIQKFLNVAAAADGAASATGMAFSSNEEATVGECAERKKILATAFARNAKLFACKYQRELLLEYYALLQDINHTGWHTVFLPVSERRPLMVPVAVTMIELSTHSSQSSSSPRIDSPIR